MTRDDRPGSPDGGGHLHTGAARPLHLLRLLPAGVPDLRPDRRRDLVAARADQPHARDRDGRARRGRPDRRRGVLVLPRLPRVRAGVPGRACSTARCSRSGATRRGRGRRRPLRLRALLWAVNRRAGGCGSWACRAATRAAAGTARRRASCSAASSARSTRRSAAPRSGSRPSSRRPPTRGAAARCTPTTASSSAAARSRASSATRCPARSSRRPADAPRTSRACSVASASRSSRSGSPSATPTRTARAGSRRPAAHRPPGLLPPAQRARRRRGAARAHRAARRVRRAAERRRVLRRGRHLRLLRPEDSARVLDRHLDEIAAADLDAIVVVNPGCYRQLEQGVKRRGLRTRVVHLAELAAERSATRATSRQNATSRSLTSSGRSCCVQCPKPSSSTLSRRSGTNMRRFGSRRSIPGNPTTGSRVADDVQRGRRDDRAVPRREQLPVAVLVAVPVQPAGEAGPRELGHVDVEVLRRSATPAARRSRAARRGSRRRRAARRRAAARCRRPGRAVARRADEQAAHRLAHVGFELGLGDARLLEVDLVEAVAERLAPGGHRRDRHPRRERDAQAGDARDRSGRSSAVCHATGAPQSWPTTIAVLAPSASISPTTSPTRSSSV